MPDQRQTDDLQPEANESPAPLRRPLATLVEEILQNPSQPSESDWTPDIQVLETPRRVEISVELPGLKRSDIDLDVDAGRLSISGEKRCGYDSAAVTPLIAERRYGAFRRTVILPRGADPARLTAVLGQGLLTISAPKRLPGAKRRLPIGDR